jgi:protein-S-isoprenylcysteine O-methyltransferase Ste14
MSSTETSGNDSKPFSLLGSIKNLLGAGMHLLLLGLCLEGLTLAVRRWVSFPISPSFEAQVVLTVPCVAACLLGGIWFNRSLDLVGVHLLHGENELITQGPFAYVRHPLYATLLIFVPPLVVIWLSDLLFIIPWALMLSVSHYVVRLEERGLVEEFGQDYERYRQYVPALLPYKGDGGRRYHADRDNPEPKLFD